MFRNQSEIGEASVEHLLWQDSTGWERAAAAAEAATDSSWEWRRSLANTAVDDARNVRMNLQ